MLHTAQQDKTKHRRIRQLAAALMALLMTAFLGACGESPEISGTYEKAMMSLEAEDYSAAAADFQNSITAGNHETDSLRGLGICCFHLGRYQEAVDAFEQCLQKLDGGSLEKAFRTDVLLYEAEACLQLGDREKAMQIYDATVSDDSSGAAYLMRGMMRLEDGDDAAAAADFQGALEKSRSLENYLQIYEAFAAVNRSGDGHTWLEQALDMHPGTPDENVLMGKVYYYLQDYEQSKEFLNKAVNDGGDGAVVLLGRVCLESGDAAGARTMYKRCIKEKHDEAVAWNGLALCDISEGKYKDALENIKNGLACYDVTENEVLLYNEIVIYEKMQDYATAKEKMAVFAERYPDNADAARENLFLQSR